MTETSPKANAVLRLCFVAGQASFEDGDTLDANPWSAETQEYRAWGAGWLHAQIKDQVAPTVH
jgi:hypothetical protein